MMKRLPEITKCLNDRNFNTKIKVYMSTKVMGPGYNPYEGNYTTGNLNPITVKGYRKEISPSSLVYRQMGIKETGAVQIVCDEKYKSYFELCNKIEIEGDEFEVYKTAVGSRASIQKQPYKMIRVVLSKK